MRQPTKKATLGWPGAALAIQGGNQLVQGGGGQGLEMAASEDRRQEAGAGGAQQVVHRFDENALESGAQVQELVKEVGLGQQAPEDGLFDRRQPHVAGQDGPGLDEDIQDPDAAGAVGGAGAAEQTAVQPFRDPLGVFEHFLGQAVQEGQLAPGDIGLPAGFGEQRADGLAQAAAHADHQLVFQLLEHLDQGLHIGHESNLL